MKQYDVLDEAGKVTVSFPESVIDPVFEAEGLATRTIVEREATFAEELEECHRKRSLEYPFIGDQLDALFKARAGDPAQIAAIDAKIVEIKAKYPKPVQV